MTGQPPFGEYLRQLRLDAGFGLRAFAETVGMKPSNLSRLETGRIGPPTSAERIAHRIFSTIQETQPTIVLDLHNDWIKSIPYTLIDPNPGYKEKHLRQTAWFVR